MGISLQVLPLEHHTEIWLYTGVPGGNVNILGGHSKQKSMCTVSYFGRFPI